MTDPPSASDDPRHALTAPSDSSKSGKGTSVALQAIDRLIAGASVDQLPDLIRARREIILQDQISRDDELDRVERLSDLQEMRTRERLSFWARMAFSAATLCTGTALTLAGFDVVGCFLLGGSMTIFVPSYVRAYLTGGESGGGESGGRKAHLISSKSGGEDAEPN